MLVSKGIIALFIAEKEIMVFALSFALMNSVHTCHVMSTRNGDVSFISTKIILCELFRPQRHKLFLEGKEPRPM